jgi:hypothetical protein
MSLLSALGADDWQDIATEYGHRFMTDSPLTLRARLSGDLLIMRQSIVESESDDARLAAPRLMVLHGMIIGNLGDAQGAARWYRAARLASDRSGDDGLQQWVRGREAFRRGYEGSAPGEVIAVASGVSDVEAKLAAAQALARLQETARAVAELDEARRIHETTNQGENTIFAMPPWRMALSSAYVFALLGDVKRCELELATVVPPPWVKRWEAQLEMQRAVAYSKSGDLATGVSIAGPIMNALPDSQRGLVLSGMYDEVIHGRQE